GGAGSLGRKPIYQGLHHVVSPTAALQNQVGKGSVKWVAVAEIQEMPQPEIILGFHSLRLVKPVDDMGALYGDGSIACWLAYDNLHQALRGL
ncbi:hypothetical protein, partial [Streptomyces melanogenes]|uniref:hypothetical protein n=1 Tax=Streptomyces melanogenes TaxID=67326 RepID=UPI001E2868A7